MSTNIKNILRVMTDRYECNDIFFELFFNNYECDVKYYGLLFILCNFDVCPFNISLCYFPSLPYTGLSFSQMKAMLRLRTLFNFINNCLVIDGEPNYLPIRKAKLM